MNNVGFIALFVFVAALLRVSGLVNRHMGRHMFMFTCLEFKKWFVRPLELRHAMV